MAGISGDGADAEQRFRDLTGAHTAPSASAGDAVLGDVIVEIKKCGTPTVNQVRAVKYLPIVCLDTRADRWFVVPAHEVVRLVARKRRGQHTENPFESATLSLNDLTAFVVAESDLADRVRQAAASSATYPGLKNAMLEVLARSESLAERSRNDVAELLQAYGLN